MLVADLELGLHVPTAHLRLRQLANDDIEAVVTLFQNPVQNIDVLLHDNDFFCYM
jgi:hypothetical protein